MSAKLLNALRLSTLVFDLRWQGLLFSFAAVASVTALQFALKLETYNVNMIYMLVTLLVTVWFGLSAGVLTAILSFFGFDYFFIPPYFTFAINTLEGWSAVILFLITAIAANQIAGRARFNSNQAQKRAQDINVLYEVATSVITTIDKTKMLERVLEQVSKATQSSSCTLFLWDKDSLGREPTLKLKVDNAIIPSPEKNLQPDISTAYSVFMHNAPIFYDASSSASLRENKFPAIVFGSFQGSNYPPRFKKANSSSVEPLAYLPLTSGTTVLGVIVFLGSPPVEFSLEEKRLLTVLASHVALAVEHARLIEETTQIAALRESNKLKSALLASVSHELRTPLTTIKTATANLLIEDITWSDQQQREFVELIEMETDRLTALVSNLLDLTKIEAGVLLPDFGWYYLPEIVEEVAERLHKSTLLKDHPLNTFFSPDIPLNRMDYLQIDQVFTNLIENAAKYSPSNAVISVRVSVEKASTVAILKAKPFVENNRDGATSKAITSMQGSENESSSQLVLLVKVIDNGSGVPIEHRERIFDKFFRISSEANLGTNKVPGTGIGLAISKGIVEAHGGQIWVGNNPGGGSIFYFTLPVALINEEWPENSLSEYE